MVKWVPAFQLSNDNKWQWWIRFTGCLYTSPRNRRRPPPPPVDEVPSRSQVDEQSTRRRLRCPPPPPLNSSTWCILFNCINVFWQFLNVVVNLLLQWMISKWIKQIVRLIHVSYLLGLHVLDSMSAMMLYINWHFTYLFDQTTRLLVLPGHSLVVD